MNTPTPPRDNLRGIVWILFSVVTASIMSVAVRELSASLDSRMIVLLRSALAAAAIFAALAVSRHLRAQIRFSRPMSHITRGIFIALSTHLGFYTLASIPLATASILFFTGPIFATILSGPMLGDHVGPRRWAAVLIGFLGALIILRPGISELHPAMLAALGSSALFALALMQSRGLAEADGPLSTYTSSTVITALISLPIVGDGWQMPPDGIAWVLTALIILTGTGRSIGDIQAYRYGEASILGPIVYLRLVLVGGAGYVLYNEVIDGPTFLGAAIIISASLYIARREARLAQNRRRARKAADIVPSSR